MDAPRTRARRRSSSGTSGSATAGHTTRSSPRRWVANLGFAHDLELVGEFRLAHDLTRRGDANRVEDTAVSLKWVALEGVLHEHDPRPALVIEASLLFPSAAGGELAPVS